MAVAGEVTPQKITKDKLHEKACQNMHPDSLKMHLKKFGGRALPGLAGGA